MIRWLRRLAVAWVVWRLIGPEPRPRFSPNQEHPLRIPGRSVFVGDYEYFVREAGPGDGPVLVLIHGWASDSVLNWYAMIPRLAERFHVVAIDQRNTGKSDHPRGPYDLVDVADEFAGVISAMELGRVHVAGYSMGGMIAQELVHRHPYLVDKLVLGGTAADVTPTRLDAVSYRATLWLGRVWDRISTAEFSAVRQRYLHRVGAVDRRHARWMWELYMSRDVNLYYEGGFAIGRFDSRDWIRRIQVPVLVVIPTEDQLVRPSFQYDLAARIPDVEVVELAGAKHESVLTHAERFATEITRFLEDPPPSPSPA